MVVVGWGGGVLWGWWWGGGGVWGGLGGGVGGLVKPSQCSPGECCRVVARCPLPATLLSLSCSEGWGSGRFVKGLDKPRPQTWE